MDARILSMDESVILQRISNQFFLFSVALNCGQQSSENNTYFESKGTESGSCTLKICPCNDNICQVFLNPKKRTAPLEKPILRS